jgi:hypothetical protein
MAAAPATAEPPTDNTFMAGDVRVLPYVHDATLPELLRCMREHPILQERRCAGVASKAPGEAKVLGTSVKLVDLYNAARAVATSEDAHSLKQLVGDS